jgi:hypothetical protein
VGVSNPDEKMKQLVLKWFNLKKSVEIEVIIGSVRISGAKP